MYRSFSVAFCCQKRRVTGQNKGVGILKKHQNKVVRYSKFTIVFQSACRLLYTQKTFVLTCRFCLFTVTQPFLKEYIYFQHFQNNFYSILELYITIMVVLVWNPQCVGVHFNLVLSVCLSVIQLMSFLHIKKIGFLFVDFCTAQRS